MSQPLMRASSEVTRSVARPVVGARVDTSKRYTDTGGSGLDATKLSSSTAEQSSAVHGLYRQALREIPAMRINYTIVEEEMFLRALIRDMFSLQRNVSDPKIVDMLIFKAKQEIGEIRGQFKGRHQIGIYIRNYHDKLAREAASRLSLAAGQEKFARELGAPAISDDAKHTMLASWRQRSLVPADLLTWTQYERWKAEENEKFTRFAVDANFFTADTLERNAKTKSQCSIM
jgi:hypothetical protein